MSESNRLGICPKCRSTFALAARGRPRLFCSTACRRGSELEVRRIQNRLERLEGELEGAQRDRLGLHDIYGMSREERVSFLECAIADGEARLRELLE